MLLPGFVRKLLAVFRGSVAPPLIFLSVLMGFWMGMMPGWSGLHTALVVIVLVVNLHLGLFLLSLGIAKALSLAGAPVLYHVGVWVHGHIPGLLAGLSSIPVVGLTDFNRFAVAGGLVVGPIVGAIAGVALALVVVNFRKMMLKIDEKSETFRKWYSKWWVRLIDRFIVGKRAKDVKSMFAKAKYVRKAGVAVAVVLVAGFLVAAHYLQNTTIRNYTASVLTKANKAEVDVNDLGLSILGGSAHVDGLQFTDPNRPQENQLAIGKIEAAADVRDLLLGKVVLENVEVSQVRFNEPRQTPGAVLPTPPAESKPFDPCDYGITAENLGKLENYVKDFKKIKEELGKLRDWLPDANKPTVKPEQAPQKYLEYLKARAQALPTWRVLAKQVLADKVILPSELFKDSRVALTNLSDAPRAAGLPIRLDVNSYDTGAAMNLTLDYSKGDGAPGISGKFKGFDLAKMQSLLSPDAGIAFQSGKASGTFTGQLTKQQVNLVIDVNLADLQAKGTGKGVLGLGAEQTSQVMEALKNLHTTIRVVGPVTDPHLAFDTQGLTAEFKQALISAGQERLAGEVNKQLEKQLGDKVSPELKESLKKPAQGLLDVLGGKKKEESKKQ
jgi:uncharacterized protein (TIGR03546 family)